MSIQYLSHDVLALIFFECGHPMIPFIRATCRRWRAIVNSPYFDNAIKGKETLFTPYWWPMTWINDHSQTAPANVLMRQQTARQTFQPTVENLFAPPAFSQRANQNLLTSDDPLIRDREFQRCIEIGPTDEALRDHDKPETTPEAGDFGIMGATGPSIAHASLKYCSKPDFGRGEYPPPPKSYLESRHAELYRREWLVVDDMWRFYLMLAEGVPIDEIRALHPDQWLDRLLEQEPCFRNRQEGIFGINEDQKFSDEIQQYKADFPERVENWTDRPRRLRAPDWPE